MGMTNETYTLVQHSAWMVGGKPQFRQAVELCLIPNSSSRLRITKAGGVLFTSYDEANAAEEKVNYPPGCVGFIPQARGTFHPTVEIGGAPLYIPAREV